MTKKVILRDLEDQSPTPVEIETRFDWGTLAYQFISGTILPAIGQAITSGAQESELAKQLKQAQEELEKTKKMMYVLIAVIVVLLIVFLVRR